MLKSGFRLAHAHCPQHVDFDSQPFVRSFETSLEELNRLRKQVQRKIGELEDVVSAAETSHRSQIRDIVKSYEVILRLNLWSWS
jgi:hypothetical protein